MSFGYQINVEKILLFNLIKKLVIFILSIICHYAGKNYLVRFYQLTHN